jgi:hypothetical protein
VERAAGRASESERAGGGGAGGVCGGGGEKERLREGWTRDTLYWQWAMGVAGPGPRHERAGGPRRGVRSLETGQEGRLKRILLIYSNLEEQHSYLEDLATP